MSALGNESESAAAAATVDVDYYASIYSGFFHGTFEWSTFLLNQLVGTKVLYNVVRTVNNDKVTTR